MSEESKIDRVMTDVAQRLRIVLIRTWKSGKYVNEYRSKIENKTLFEVLESVHRKCKTKSKNKRKKNKQKGEASDHPNSIKDEETEINNLPKHKQQLEDVIVKELLAVDTDQLECSEKMKVQDTPLLCYILLNSLLGLHLPGKVKEAIIKIRDIRNSASHSHVEHDKKWFKDCMGDIQECMHVLSEEYTLEPFEPSSLPSLEDLKERVDQNYEPSYMFINFQYQDGTNNNIQSFEKFITERRTSSITKSCVIALSGNSGSGKSTIVSQLAHQLSKKDVFKLVVLVNEEKRSKNQKKISKNQNPVDLFFSGLNKLAPDLFVDNEDDLKEKLKLHMRDILVILDINADYPKEMTSSISEGNWIITTSADFESCDVDNLHVLKIKPLDENQVKDFLAKLNQDKKELRNIMSKYNDCACKKSLNTPELIMIFSSLKGDAPVTSEIRLIQHLFDKKMEALEGKEKRVILGLGKQACKCIKMKTDYIPNKFNCEEAIIQTFLVTEEKQLKTEVTVTEEKELKTKVTYKKFQHTLLRDFLCAHFIVENPADAFKLYCLAPSFYKRAFKLACYLAVAVSTGKFKKDFKDHLEKYLSCLFTSEERRDSLVFQSWGFVFHIDEACQFKDARKNIVVLLAQLIGKYDRWNINCRDLKEANIKIICDIIKSMKVGLEKLVILELVLHIDVMSFAVADRLWNVLRNLKIPFKLCVKVDIVHREFLRKECFGSDIKESLNNFCQSINERCISNNLSVVEYKGPMLLSYTLDPFGSESPLRGLASLEVHVFDIFSLRRLLSCKELESLRTLNITFEMSNPNENVETLCHLFSEQNDKLRMSLNVVNYKEIQKLLNRIKDMKCLTSLGILDVTVEDLTGNDRIDLKDFKTLETLELRAKMGDMDEDVSTSRTSILTNVLLPERLYCLIMNGFRISDTSFICGLDDKRMIITSGGVRVSDIPALLGESLESYVKDDDKIKKKKRYSKEKRDELRRWPQPRKKEIIITQEKGVDEDWSHFVKVKFHHVIRALQGYQGTLFAYKSGKITFRKDVCEDIRICLPVELLNDDVILEHENPSGKGDLEFLHDMYRTLSLVQYITLEETSLSVEGVYRFTTKLIETKKVITEGGEVDPFHLSLVNSECIKVDMKGSELHKFVVNSKELDRFSFSCKKDCCHLCKTVDKRIWINGLKLNC